MGRVLGKLLRYSLYGLLALVIIGGAAFLWYRSAVQPQIAGTLTLKGVQGPVEIVRDKEAVPHIYGKSEADVMFAQGFVHAQDRLWQMELNRRIANGAMAEILGPKALEIDLMLRTLGVRRAAEAMYQGMDADTKAALDAYAAGVNAYLKTRSSPLPPEFLLTGAPAPKDWSPIDSIGWTIMMAWDLGGNYATELQRMRLAQAGLSFQQIKDFTPDPSGTPLPENIRDFTALYKSLVAETDIIGRLFAQMPGYVEGMGSNNWVVSGARSETGKPLLANDPHLGLSAPALWYFTHLSAPDYNVIGASLPGVPGIVLGRNERIAWGFTNTGPDVQDLYVEKIDPQNPHNYLTPDGSQPFTVIEEVIKVKGEADKVLKVRLSRHGPIVSDGAHEGMTAASPKGHAIAFRWTALDADNRTPQAARKMAKARNWTEFREAVKDFHAPQQNMVYADIDGNIGYIAPGKVPIRAKDNDLHGLFPAPGWEAKYDWAGFIPFDELPQVFNPPEGFRITANQKIVGADYPYFLTSDWAQPYRADRIKAMLEAMPKHSMASFKAMQADVTSLYMQEMLPLLLAVKPAGERETKAVALLKGWAATLDMERAEPLIANAWIRELNRGLYEDETGVLFQRMFEQKPLLLIRALKGEGDFARWCDNIATPQVETCSDQVAAALTRALDDLTRRYGADMAAWRWGKAHEARSTHRPFGSVKPLDKVFDLRVETGGDTFTVNVGRHRISNEEEPFTSIHAASLRTLFDLSKPNGSRYIHSTGQSGIVLSPFYSNMTERWAKGDSIPMSMDRKDIEADAIGTLKLVP